MIKLTFLKEFLLIKQAHQKSVIFRHYWYFLDKGFKLQEYVSKSCHHVLMSANLNNIAILNINSADYRCIINGISKSDAVNLLQNTNLTEERGVL